MKNNEKEGGGRRRQPPSRPRGLSVNLARSASDFLETETHQKKRWRQERLQHASEQKTRERQQNPKTEKQFWIARLRKSKGEGHKQRQREEAKALPRLCKNIMKLQRNL